MSKIKIEPCVVHTPKKEQWEELLQWLEDNTDLKWPSGCEDEREFSKLYPNMEIGIDELDGVRDEKAIKDGRIPYEQFKEKYMVADLEKFKESGTKAWAGKNAQEWIDEIRGRKPEVDRIPDTSKTIKPKKKKRTWEVNTEVRSSDGITVSEDYVLIKDDEGGIVWREGKLNLETS